MYKCLYLLSLIYSTFAFSQKKTITYDDLHEWKSLGGFIASPNGKYVLYDINNEPISKGTLVIKSLDGKYERKFMNTSGAFNTLITNDNRYVVFMQGLDSMCIVDLKDKELRYVENVTSYKVIKGKESNFLTYRTKDNQFNVLKFEWEHPISFSNNRDYKVSEDGSILILINDNPDIGGMKIEVVKVDIPKFSTKRLWHGEDASDFYFDRLGTQFAFKAKDVANSIWCIDLVKNMANLVIRDSSNIADSPFIIEHLYGFTNDMKNLILSVFPSTVDSPLIPDTIKFDLWSYKDTQLQSQQLLEDKRIGGVREIIRISDHVRFKIENNNSRYISHNGDYFLIEQYNAKVDISERNWNPFALKKYYIFSTLSYQLNQIEASNINDCKLSPNGRYVVFYDWKKKTYFSYCTLTSTIKNLTKKLNVNWVDEEDDHPNEADKSGKILGWARNDSLLFISDYFDIWQIDPNCMNLPINITNGYGKKQNIVFNFIDNEISIIDTNKIKFFLAFNKINKTNGYFKRASSNGKDPIYLSMGQYNYSRPIFLKNSGNKDRLIVTRESEKESPNLFFTYNFVDFHQLSKIGPEKRFNWITSELLSWKLPDGRLVQGILYKPENFDPHHKYPVIFNFYERRSHKIYTYIEPDYARGNINIPLFVSNGYLVFCPDIHYKISEPGYSALRSIVSAANLLSKLSYVDSSRMGLQGHSFGGYETNFIITQSNLFRAAMSAAGVSDYISSYGSLWGNGASRQGAFELGQHRMGGTLWEMPEMYIKNSPVFYANRIETPLFMMMNKNDNSVSFSQGIEFFTALRRLGKKVWMIQYDDEGHILLNDIVARDFTTRVMQFFDTYLKNYPEPNWMKYGIKANVKDRKNGL